MQILRKRPPDSDSAESNPRDVVLPVFAPPNAPRPFLVRFWRFWRGLVRQKQDSSEVRRLRAVIAAQDARVLADLQTMRQALQAAEEEIRVLTTLRVPKLERELEVEKAYSENLATALERERSRLEAEIAINHMKTASGRAAEADVLRRGEPD